MENSLHGNIRLHHSKGDNHRLRHNGRVPGVLYGLNGQNMLVEFSELELFHTIENSGEHSAIRLNVTGQDEDVLIKEVQRDPMTKKITHIDFQRVDNNKRIHTKIPVVIKGDEYFRNTGIIIQQQVNEVEVEGIPSRLPKYIVADVTNMTAKDKLTIGDLEVSEEISILSNHASTVVTLANTKHADVEEEKADEPMAIHAE